MEVITNLKVDLMRMLAGTALLIAVSTTPVIPDDVGPEEESGGHTSKRLQTSEPVPATRTIRILSGQDRAYAVLVFSEDRVLPITSDESLVRAWAKGTSGSWARRAGELITYLGGKSKAEELWSDFDNVTAPTEGGSLGFLNKAVSLASDENVLRKTISEWERKGIRLSADSGTHIAELWTEFAGLKQGDLAELDSWAGKWSSAVKWEEVAVKLPESAKIPADSESITIPMKSDIAALVRVEAIPVSSAPCSLRVSKRNDLIRVFVYRFAEEGKESTTVDLPLRFVPKDPTMSAVGYLQKDCRVEVEMGKPGPRRSLLTLAVSLLAIAFLGVTVWYFRGKVGKIFSGGERPADGSVASGQRPNFQNEMPGTGRVDEPRTTPSSERRPPLRSSPVTEMGHDQALVQRLCRLFTDSRVRTEGAGVVDAASLYSETERLLEAYQRRVEELRHIGTALGEHRNTTEEDSPESLPAESLATRLQRFKEVSHRDKAAATAELQAAQQRSKRLIDLYGALLQPLTELSERFRRCHAEIANHSADTGLDQVEKEAATLSGMLRQLRIGEHEDVKTLRNLIARAHTLSVTLSSIVRGFADSTLESLCANIVDRTDPAKALMSLPPKLSATIPEDEAQGRASVEELGKYIRSSLLVGDIGEAIQYCSRLGLRLRIDARCANKTADADRLQKLIEADQLCQTILALLTTVGLFVNRIYHRVYPGMPFDRSTMASQGDLATLGQESIDSFETAVTEGVLDIAYVGSSVLNDNGLVHGDNRTRVVLSRRSERLAKES